MFDVHLTFLVLKVKSAERDCLLFSTELMPSRNAGLVTEMYYELYNTFVL